MVVITADDYGKSAGVTDSIRECFSEGRITSVSAMMFMEDSERSASIAMEDGMAVGLHLNFTLPFNALHLSSGRREGQERIGRYLRGSRFAPAVYNPFLAGLFVSSFKSQEEEFIRLYGRPPDFYNGHHHMHLCANIRAAGLIPEGAAIRRSFTFVPGERHGFSVLYQDFIGAWVLRHFVSTDSFFSIAPVRDRKRLEYIIGRAAGENVELEVHPENRDEMGFLLSDSCGKMFRGADIGGFSRLRAGNGAIKEGVRSHEK